MIERSKCAQQISSQLDCAGLRAFLLLEVAAGQNSSTAAGFLAKTVTIPRRVNHPNYDRVMFAPH